jgi:hypothetical protein
MTWTVFEYLYRDAGNFKAFGSVLLKGRVSDDNRDAIRSRLESGEFFIAEQVGVPPLYEQLYQWSAGPTESDHCWHEFVGFREIDGPESSVTYVGDAATFVARFAAVTGWEESLSPHSALDGVS